MKSGERVSVKNQQRPRAGHHAMALVLAVGGVADLLGEREMGVLQRPHERRVHAHVHRFQAIGIARRVQHAIEGFGVGAFRFGDSNDGSIGLGENARRHQRIVDKPRSPPAQPRVEFARLRLAVAGASGGASIPEDPRAALRQSDRKTAGPLRARAPPSGRSRRAPRSACPTPPASATGGAGRCRRACAPW